MWSRTLLVIFAASVASGDFVANQFMDQILHEMRAQVLQSGLDPIRANPFSVLVRKTGPFNHDFSAQFMQGSGYGLSNVARLGDCSYGTDASGLMKLGCNVALGSFKFLMNADVKGDTFMEKTHSISTSSQVSTKTYALIEVQGARGHESRLARITVPSVTLTTNVIQGKLDLNSSRFAEFVSQMNANLANQLALTMTNGYSQVLSGVLARHSMP